MVNYEQEFGLLKFDPYTVLESNPKSSPGDIKDKRNKLVKETHQDKLYSEFQKIEEAVQKDPLNPELQLNYLKAKSEYDIALEKTKAINYSFDILSSDEKRRAYDEYAKKQGTIDVTYKKSDLSNVRRELRPEIERVMNFFEREFEKLSPAHPTKDFLKMYSALLHYYSQNNPTISDNVEINQYYFENIFSRNVQRISSNLERIISSNDPKNTLSSFEKLRTEVLEYITKSIEKVRYRDENGEIKEKEVVRGVSPYADNVVISNDDEHQPGLVSKDTKFKKKIKVDSLDYINSIISSDAAKRFVFAKELDILFNGSESNIKIRDLMTGYRIFNIYSLQELLKIDPETNKAILAKYAKELGDPVLEGLFLENNNITSEDIIHTRITSIESDVLSYKYKKSVAVPHVIKKSQAIAERERFLSKIYNEYQELDNLNVEQVLEYLESRNKELYNNLTAYVKQVSFYDERANLSLETDPVNREKLKESCKQLQKEIKYKYSHYLEKDIVKKKKKPLIKNKEISDMVADAVIAGSVGTVTTLFGNVNYGLIAASSTYFALKSPFLKSKAKALKDKIINKIPDIKYSVLEYFSELKEIYLSKQFLAYSLPVLGIAYLGEHYPVFGNALFNLPIMMAKTLSNIAGNIEVIKPITTLIQYMADGLSSLNASENAGSRFLAKSIVYSVYYQAATQLALGLSFVPFIGKFLAIPLSIFGSIKETLNERVYGPHKMDIKTLYKGRRNKKHFESIKKKTDAEGLTEFIDEEKLKKGKI
ncbi:MAG: hypothetical protein WC755_01555 [Candidatus Woesearchaeota archaeon]